MASMHALHGATRTHPVVVASAVLALLIGGIETAVAQSSSTRRPSDDPSSAVTADPDAGLLPEPHVIDRSIRFATRLMSSSDGGEVKSGFYPEFANMVTGAGWISAGPGYRGWLFGDEALVDVSAAISWRGYKMTQARFELPHLARSRLVIGSQARWQDLTQLSYFGNGPDTLEENRSEYRLRSTNIVGYAVVRPTRVVSITGRVGWLASPSLDAPAGTFKRGNPDARQVFAAEPAFQLDEQPAYLYSEAWIASDTRDHRGHPSSGGLYRAGWTRYADRRADMFSFQRYEAEAAHFMPLASRRAVLAVRGWLVGSATAEGHTVPLYLAPSLGGANTLRSYADYRFHDRNLVVVNVESRVALFTHVDAALFVDAGNVAARIGDLNLDRRSYGFGFRLHSERQTFARLDIADGGEGWRMVVRINDPLSLSRILRRTAAVPFVP